jgi:type II secretory pathway component PulF
VPRYRYKARDGQGEQITDELDAATEIEARQILESRGLQIEELKRTPRETPATLSTAESQQVTNRLAQLTNMSLPLAAGLRAAADECGNGRVARAMHEIANRVENGQSLDEVIANSGDLFPPHVAGLVLAATKTGKLGAALGELLEHQRSARELRKSITQGFAYPLFVVCLAALLILVVICFVSVPFIRMFTEFELMLPLSTRLLIWWREYGLTLIGCAAVGTAALSTLLRLVLPRAYWSRMIAGIPVVGPLSHWAALAEWCSLLSVLIKNQVALPEALRLSAVGIENAYVGKIATELGERTAEGQSLSELLATSRPLPISLVPLVRWGERAGSLDEAFGTARELFDRRVRVRALLLQSILPPLLFVVIACGVVMVIGALFAPLLSLVTGLS